MAYQSNVILLVTFIVFVSGASIQIFYYLFFYLAIHRYKYKSDLKTEKKAVSVIICARNEAENLNKFLPAVLKQDYPDFEVIVVNDCSEDNSYEILGKYQAIYPSLKISTLNKDPKFTHTKKFAQFIGIKAAKNDILLFSDADCEPESDQWLKVMTSHFDDNIIFVLGYGGYFDRKGLLNKYIRYDSMTIAMQYLGMAIRGMPYMGVGRNLAYKRSAFFANNGYGPFSRLASGDDDLLVNNNATRNNTRVEFRRGTHTRSVPYSNINEWINQKKRHLTTAPFYKLRDKILLITEPLTRLIFYSTFVLLLSTSYLWPFVTAVFILRFTIQLFILRFTEEKLNEQGILKYALIFDIFSPIINSVLYLSNIRGRPGKNRWK